MRFLDTHNSFYGNDLRSITVEGESEMCVGRINGEDKAQQTEAGSAMLARVSSSFPAQRRFDDSPDRSYRPSSHGSLNTSARNSGQIPHFLDILRSRDALQTADVLPPNTCYPCARSVQ